MMILGGIVISDDDMPESIPIGGTLESKDVKLSDGSRILKVTGFTPNDFKITGFMRGRDATGDPLTRFEAIEQMCRDHLPQTLIWKGVRATRSYPVIVQVVNGNIIENSNISYDITLFRQSNSGLVYSGYTVAPTRNEQIREPRSPASKQPQRGRRSTTPMLPCSLPK
jgi:hypothetical protein